MSKLSTDLMNLSRYLLILLVWLTISGCAIEQLPNVAIEPPQIPPTTEPMPTLEPFSTNGAVVVRNLIYPRGLEFGPDGNLYVAEAGTGGEDVVTTTCNGREFSSFPAMNGRVSKIAPDGSRTTVVAGLPAAEYGIGDVLGTTDVAWMDNTLYVLTAGGGCSRGLPDSPSGIMQVQPDGSWSVIADFSAYLSTHDDELPKDDDWEPDGSLWNMVVAEGDFYVVDTNHGELYKATPDGTITRLTTITEQFGQINPTALAYRDGYFYLSNLHGFPITQGASILLKVSLNGDFEVIAEGLTGVLSLAFDAQGELYALETSTTDNTLPQPGAGRVVRVRSGEPLQTVVSGLTFPTAMTFGPDGKLYIAHNAYWNEAGLGEIIRIDMEPE